MKVVHNHIYLKKERIIFCCLPKVANTSIKFAISEAKKLKKHPVNIHQHPYFQNRTLHSLAAIHSLRQKVPDLLMIAIVRNPFARLASCWRSKMWKSPLRMPELNVPLRCSFEKFAKAVCKQKDINSNMHYRSQHFGMFFKDKFLPTHWYRLENLTPAWKEIQSLSASRGLILPDIKHTNRSGVKNWRNHYTQEIYQSVRKRFQRDLNLFYPIAFC